MNISYNILDFTAEKIYRKISTLKISRLEEYDSYCISPGYYGFTGRNGIWIAESDSSLLVFCKHPNTPDRLLIFPEICSYDSFLLTLNFLERLNSKEIDIQLARFSQKQKELLLEQLKVSSNDRKLTLQSMQEEVLDWKYPTYILNTESVLLRKGSGFEQLRQRLRKLEKSSITTAPLDPDRHRKEILKHVNRWANHSSYDCYSLDDLMSPAMRLLDLFESKPSQFSGQVLYINNTLQSYCIWEYPLINGLPANELAIASSKEIQGLSEWQMVLMCEQMYKEGILRVNVGGSETHGLDRFKRKFAPCKSRKLFSLETEQAHGLNLLEVS